MKNLILISIIILFSSCRTHKDFYAYEDKKTNTYAVLEIPSKKSNVKFSYSSDNNPDKYVVEGTKDFLINDLIGIPVFYNLLTINSRGIDVCSDLNGKPVFFYKRDKTQTDKIILYKNASNKIECFDSLEGELFPPYLIKTDRIDYSKFSNDFKSVFIELDKGRKSINELDALIKRESSDK